MHSLCLWSDTQALYSLSIWLLTHRDHHFQTDSLSLDVHHVSLYNISELHPPKQGEKKTQVALGILIWVSSTRSFVLPWQPNSKHRHDPVMVFMVLFIEPSGKHAVTTDMERVVSGRAPARTLAAVCMTQDCPTFECFLCYASCQSSCSSLYLFIYFSFSFFQNRITKFLMLSNTLATQPCNGYWSRRGERLAYRPSNCSETQW